MLEDRRNRRQALGEGYGTPQLVVKCYGVVTERIIAEVQRLGMRTHDPPELVGLDAQTPPQLHQVVAELLAWVASHLNCIVIILTQIKGLLFDRSLHGLYNFSWRVILTPKSGFSRVFLGFFKMQPGICDDYVVFCVTYPTFRVIIFSLEWIFSVSRLSPLPAGVRPKTSTAAGKEMVVTGVYS